MVELIGIIYVLLSFAGGTVFTAFLIFYTIFKYPEKVKIWGALFARLFARLSIRMANFFVAKNLEGTIMAFSKDINKECEDVLPHELKLMWVDKQERRDTFIRKGRVVVKMFDYKNQAKNLVYTVLDFISLGLLPDAKTFVEKNVNNAMEFAVAEKFFVKKGRYDCFNIFDKEFINPELKNKTKVGKYFEWMRKLDELGMFGRVLLEDFKALSGLTAIGNISNVRNETVGYMENMGLVAERKSGELFAKPLGFKGDFFQTAIIFIADPLKFQTQGTRPYLNYVNKLMNAGYKNFYIFARERNIRVAKKIAEDLTKNRKLMKINEEEFYGKIRMGKPTKCISITFALI